MSAAQYRALQESAQHATATQKAAPARAQNAAAIGGKELATVNEIEALVAEERRLMSEAMNWLRKMGWSSWQMEIAYEENTTVLLCPGQDKYGGRRAVFQTVLTLTHEFDEGTLLVAADAEMEGKIAARDELLATDRKAASVRGVWKVDKENYRPPPRRGDEPPEG